MLDLDRQLAAACRATGGVFTTRMAHDVGVSRGVIHRRARRGLVQRLHPGVYFLGAVVTLDARRWAAVLAGPDGTVLTGAAAEDEWGIGRWPSDSVEILVPSRRRPLEGVRVDESCTIHPEDRTVHAGRPIASVERTLLDLAGRRFVLSLCRSLREAEFRNLLRIVRLERTLRRNPTRAGAGRLARALELHRLGHGGVDSSYEERFARKLRGAGIRGVATNVEFTIGGVTIRVDVWIEHLNLVVEVDPDWHLAESALREDTLRRALCRRDGKLHLRVPGGDLDWGVAQVLAMQPATRTLRPS